MRVSDRDRCVRRRAAIAPSACPRGWSGQGRARPCPRGFRRMHPRSASARRAACRRQGRVPARHSPRARRPAFAGVRPSTSFRGSMALITPVRIDPGRQRHLHENAVYGRIGVERLDLSDEARFRTGSRDSDGRTRCKPGFVHGLALGRDIDRARRIVADQRPPRCRA